MSRAERDVAAPYDALTEPMLAVEGVTRSTMMGFPCLRYHGDFFASCDRSTGDLVVKLDAATVYELVAAGRADPFAPAGRRFREWVTIPRAASRSWSKHLDAALACARARATA